MLRESGDLRLHATVCGVEVADQAERAGLAANHLDNVRRFVERAEQFSSGPQARAAVANLRAVSNQIEATGDHGKLVKALRDLADSLS